jgi:hypothetical protein
MLYILSTKCKILIKTTNFAKGCENKNIEHKMKTCSCSGIMIITISVDVVVSVGLTSIPHPLAVRERGTSQALVLFPARRFSGAGALGDITGRLRVLKKGQNQTKAIKNKTKGNNSKVQQQNTPKQIMYTVCKLFICMR